MKLLETLKEKLPKKLFTKKSLIIIAVVVAVGGFAAFKLIGGNPKEPAFVPVDRTTVLTKTSLINSVSVTGKVNSIDVVNVTTTLAYKVKEILVQVGDSVKKGDIIAKLDTTDLEKSIAEERKKLSESKSTAQDALNKTITKKDESEDAVAKAENDWNKSKVAMDNAYSPYNVARNSIAVPQNEFNSATATQQTLGIAMNNAYSEMNNATTAAANAATALNNAITAEAAAEAAHTAAKIISDADLTNVENAAATAAALAAWDNAKAATAAARTADTDAKAAVPIATNKHTVAKKDYEDQVSITGAKETALATAKTASNFDALSSAYASADLAEEAKRATFESAKKLRDADVEAYRTAQKAFDNAGTSTTLEDLLKKLEECTIKAETNGVITAINAVVGSAMGQSANAGTGPLAVIQDTDNLVISTSFKEYDIPNISIGQKVNITSDATGDKVITGYVSQISMTATSGQSGEVAFPAEIRVDTADSGLLVGMNAKANVILSQKDNIFVVPDDAIGTNEKGERVVYLKNGEAYDPIVVTLGVANDFYTEIISSELKEGAIIRSSADAAGAGMMGGMAGSDAAGAAGGMSGGSVVMIG